ncbi:MAG: class I SAM-dependent methyltransferase [Nitrospirales bacterium]|nr:methyltransferase domain-containing protein [Nitrospirales bacterium]
MTFSKEQTNIGHGNGMNTEEAHLGGYIRSDKNQGFSSLLREHGDPATWTPQLWEWAYKKLSVRSVLDVGCGEGHSTKFFKDLGCAVLGIDGSLQAKRDSVIPDFHVSHDFVNGPFLLDRQFDLVWCCEFVEHVEERFSENFFQTFSAGGKFLMLTYASPGQPGWHHVNCQPGSYWIKKLEAIGFAVDPFLTYESRNVAEPGHYQRKGLLFVRKVSSGL